MDSDRKTLAELSSEVKEKKYVTLEVGSKISGYTPEYLDRLCRLDKVEHGLLAKGGFALELQSLLRETHTILISDVGIVFVDDKDLAILPPVSIRALLTPPTPQTVSANIPPAVGVPKEPYVAVVPQVPHKPASSPPVQVAPRQSFTPPATFLAQVEESIQSPALVDCSSAEQDFKVPPEVESSFTPAVSPQAEISRPSLIPPAPVTTLRPEPALGDEWDALLLGGDDSVREEKAVVASPAPSSYETPSVYRPIKTSVDPSPHHDPAPLFSFSKKNDTKIPGAPVQTTASAPAVSSPPAPIPESAREQLVAVPSMQAVGEQRVSPPTPPISPDQRGKSLSGFSNVTAAPRISPELSRPPLPAMRVMPQGQKATEEHHLTVPEQHSLTKSIVLKTFLAFLAVSSAFLLLSEIFPDTTEALLAGSRTFYVAGVDLASPENRAMLP